MEELISKVPISEEAKKNIVLWVNEFGEEVRDYVVNLVNLREYGKLEENFYKKLEFGTGGMRGKMEIGTNRMNKFNIWIATQGLANYLKKLGTGKELSCVIGYDTRKNSYEFAREAARVLVGNGIRCYFIEKPMPTPFISFAIRYLKASSGIMITASHNPPEYNGYKVYWNDGAQVVSPHDKGIIEEVYKISSSKEINIVNESELLNSSLFQEVLSEIKDAYLKVLRINLGELYNVEDLTFRKNLRIAYTPLHGTSINLTIDALNFIGFENIFLVEEECTTDGTFSAVVSPNPEDDRSFTRVIKLAKEKEAHVFFAADPDADRVRAGIISDGEPYLFSGNQIASMMLNWVLSKLLQKGMLPENGFVVTTIVTTDLIRKIANNFGVETFLTLTGFKYIGEKIREYEGKKKFVFGCEESIGYLYGDDVRDKDSVISTCILSLMVEDLLKEGITLKDYLMNIYRKYGVHVESLLSLEFEGIEGIKKIEGIINKLRNQKLDELGGHKVVSRIDLKNRIIEDFEKNTKEDYKTDLPLTNTVIINLEGGNRFILRPSGTEPKLKVYFFSEFGNDVENYESYLRKHNDLVEEFKRKFID
ncbi:MAG: phospho-sugar mutase [Brevinematia bacterium]